MPYIPKENRTVIDIFLDDAKTYLKADGTLNYFLFKLAKLTCNRYKDFRDFIGELEAVKLEIYRRQIAPYEDKKIKENGDVK